jgi:DNA (cytosine-5)-methyltransferase 1
MIDLFSGAGGLSAGFKSKGFKPLLAVELSADAVESYNRNIAPVAVRASVDSVAPQKCELLLAGPPCQGFSTLGLRDPQDERNSMCLRIPNWAQHSGASVVVVENVPPFLESVQWRRMVRKLEAQGYEYLTWVLDAADYGAPQRRERAFTIASKIGLPDMPKKKRTVTVDDVFRRAKRCDPMNTWPSPSPLAMQRFRLIPAGGDWRDVYRRHPDRCPPSWTKLGVHATDVWGRMKLGAPSNTLKSRFQNPSLGRYIHPEDDRVISLREGARIQGMPDDWLLFGTRTSVTRQIGNGVPVPLARAIGASVRELFI